ncbi:MAG TPA: hypothetical protein PK514_15610, partial [Spirochaetota bacterium]|nr:hypothetical protein [Spirochaetota bacterium]
VRLRTFLFLKCAQDIVHYQKKVTALFCFVSIFCVFIKPADAQSTVLLAGIQGTVGTIGEIFPDDSDYNESKINNKLNLGWGFFGEVKFLQAGNWFHDIYISYDRSKGAFSFQDYKNAFTAESYTLMYRIGGFTAAPEDGKVNFFMFAEAGLALDRYLSGDFSDDTNSMLAGKPYLVRPVFGLGGA